MRFLELHEITADTLRDILQSWLMTAKEHLRQEAAGEAMRWDIADAEEILRELGDSCDCCRVGRYSNPYTGECLGCHHPLQQHEEYSGPLGEKGVWTS